MTPRAIPQGWTTSQKCGDFREISKKGDAAAMLGESSGDFKGINQYIYNITNIYNNIEYIKSLEMGKI